VSTKSSALKSRPRSKPAVALNAAPVALLTPDGNDREFMTTLAKGLAVMRAFNGERVTMTLSQTAEVADLTRATARRILRTLAALGYVSQDGRQFALTPKTLELGFGYLSAQSWIDQAVPLMKELSTDVRESCSAAILQGIDIVYVARIPTTRIMSVAVAVGSRLPAFYTSLGRAQLGFLEDAEIWRRIMSMRLEPYTTNTITEPQALFDRIAADREQGFSIVDEELERGLRSIAVPVVNRKGEAFAALNVSTNSTRITRNHMRDQFLPKLRSVSERIASFLA
jgi:IclR family pca regulon transcriptional regulator